jgi:hypothetical protein
MSLESEFTVNYGAKTVTHTSETTVYTVLAFFQWLAAKFAAASQMDDDYAFVSDTPQVYRWVNGWAMGDETSYQYLKGGSIESSDATKLFSNLYSIGDQFRNSMIYIIQADAEVTPWWSPGNIDILIKVKDGTLIDSGNVLVMSRDTDGLYDHNVTNLAGGGRNPVGINTFEDLNYKNTGDIYLDVDVVTGFDVGNYAYGNTSTASGRIQYVDTPNTRLYLCQVEGTFQTTETIKERTSRTVGDTGSTAANHATTAEFPVIRGYSDIKAVHVQRKFEGGTTSGGPFIVGEVVTQTGSAATFKFAAEVSNILYVENTAGSPNGTGLLTGGSSSATYTPTSTAAQATVNKDLNNGAGVKPYNVVVDCSGRTMQQAYQYLKYICNHNSLLVISGDEGEEYRSCSEGVYTDSKQAPFGTFAGGTFFGARGVWVDDYAAATFQLTDANGDQQLPPNYQRASCAHASLSGCQVLIAERSGSSLIKNQYTIQGVTSNSITVTATINANKTPLSGNLRVGDTQFAYTSFSGVVFSGVTPNPTGQTGDLYVPLLDVLADAATEESANIIYTAAFDVRARVRKYGFKDFTLDTSFGTGGVAVTAILQNDPQAT